MKFTEKYPDADIRALSWKQPYGSLMLFDKVETRTWNTKYRGWVLICASKAPYTGLTVDTISGKNQYKRIEALTQEIKEKHLYITSFTFPGDITSRFPLAKAIAVGRLVDSRPMQKSDEDSTFVQYREPWQEKRTYTRFKHIELSGRIEEYKETKMVDRQLWCHTYEDVQPIIPFAWDGTQGWKTLDQATKDKIILI